MMKVARPQNQPDSQAIDDALESCGVEVEPCGINVESCGLEVEPCVVEGDGDGVKGNRVPFLRLQIGLVFSESKQSH
jgi:hypothetical protein